MSSEFDMADVEYVTLTAIAGDTRAVYAVHPDDWDDFYPAHTWERFEVVSFYIKPPSDAPDLFTQRFNYFHVTILGSGELSAAAPSIRGWHK